MRPQTPSRSPSVRCPSSWQRANSTLSEPGRKPEQRPKSQWPQAKVGNGGPIHLSSQCLSLSVSNAHVCQARSQGVPLPLSPPHRFLPVLGKEVPLSLLSLPESEQNIISPGGKGQKTQKYLYFNSRLLEIEKLTPKADCLQSAEDCLQHHTRLDRHREVCVSKHIFPFTSLV